MRLMILILMLAPAVAQGQTKTELRQHPELTPEKIQSYFRLGSWGLKKFEIVKQNGHATSCYSETLVHPQKTIRENKLEGCDTEAARYSESDISLVFIVVFRFDRELRDAIRSKHEYRVPHSKMILSGYRYSDNFLDSKFTPDLEANSMINEIYSVLEHGRINVFLGQELPQ